MTAIFSLSVLVQIYDLTPCHKWKNVNTKERCFEDTFIIYLYIDASQKPPNVRELLAIFNICFYYQ